MSQLNVFCLTVGLYPVWLGVKAAWAWAVPEMLLGSRMYQWQDTSDVPYSRGNTCDGGSWCLLLNSTPLYLAFLPGTSGGGSLVILPVAKPSGYA